MTVYYTDDQVTLHHGRDLDVLRTLPDQSVNCVVTSPPYFGLRDYGVDGQRGLEGSPAEYVAGLVEVFAEVRRVLADDGTCWLNLGDSYASGAGFVNPSGRSEESRAQYKNAGPMRGQGGFARGGSDLPAKNLLGIPWRVAFALQDDGWTLRNAIVWNKPNAMPESVTDRLSTRYELVFLLTKARRYWFDLDAVREPHKPDAVRISRQRAVNRSAGHVEYDEFLRSRRIAQGRAADRESDEFATLAPGGANPGDVWTIPTAPFAEAHFAVMPLALAERCIQAGCKPGGVVLDPYSGSGTTGHAALRHGRRYIGIDLKAEYHDLALRTRLQQGALIPDIEPPHREPRRIVEHSPWCDVCECGARGPHDYTIDCHIELECVPDCPTLIPDVELAP